MWQFTAHRHLRRIRWTWARVGHDGHAIEQSPYGFPTFDGALADAAVSGFRPGHDPCRMIESGRDRAVAAPEAPSW